MTQAGFTLFDTAIGRCGIAWSARGITHVLLPAATDGATRERLRRLCAPAEEAAPPRGVQQTIDAIGGLLRGVPDDLQWVVLDVGALPDFHRRVYDAARAIPPGRTDTYGELAARLGEPGAARAVGQALGRTRFRSSCRAIACWLPAAGGRLFRAGRHRHHVALLEIEGAFSVGQLF